MANEFNNLIDKEYWIHKTSFFFFLLLKPHSVADVFSSLPGSTFLAEFSLRPIMF